MNRNYLFGGFVILSFGLGGCLWPPHPVPPFPPAPTSGACAGLSPVRLATITGKELAIGKTLLWLDKTENFDAKIIGGGGGGGGARAKKEHPWGGGGHAAEFKPVLAFKNLGGEYYLIDVGVGGVGGTSSHWESEPKNGTAGTDTRISRCSSDFTIAISHGGAAGIGDGVGEYGRQQGQAGENVINAENHQIEAKGGEGGLYDKDGQAAYGAGAGGGGQGATEQLANTRQGGKGGDGFAILWKVNKN